MDDLKINVSVEKLIKIIVEEQRAIIRKLYKDSMGEATAMLVDTAEYPTTFDSIKAFMS